jgi:hypothetical protein
MRAIERWDRTLFAPFGEPETGLTGGGYFAIVYRMITN